MKSIVVSYADSDILANTYQRIIKIIGKSVNERRHKGDFVFF